MSKILQTLRRGKGNPKEEGLSEIQEALILADISRLMGNPNWRDVFTRLSSDSPILSDLASHCNETVLDLAYSNMR